VWIFGVGGAHKANAYGRQQAESRLKTAL